MTNFTFQLGRLTKDIEAAITKWDRPGRQPTLADMSQSVKSWEDDVARLGNYDESISPGYSQAFKSAQAAWHNRDQRAAVMGHLKNTLAALKSITGETQADPNVNTYQRRAVKTLFGDVAESYRHAPSVYGDLHTISRQVAGLKQTDHRNVNPVHVKTVKQGIYDFSMNYVDSNRAVYNAGMKAIQYIDQAMRFAGKSGHYDAAWNEAARQIDSIAQLIAVNAVPDGHKPPMSAFAAKAVLEQVQALDAQIYNKPFSAPIPLLRTLAEYSNHLVTAAAQCYDPKTTRLASSIKSLIHSSLENARKPSIKAIGGLGWRAVEVETPLETAFNQLAELESHLQSF